MHKPKSIKSSICFASRSATDMPRDINTGSWITLKIGSSSFTKFLLGSWSHTNYFTWTSHTHFLVSPLPSTHRMVHNCPSVHRGARMQEHQVLFLLSFLRIWSNSYQEQKVVSATTTPAALPLTQTSLFFLHLMSGLTPSQPQFPPLMPQSTFFGMISSCSCQI